MRKFEFLSRLSWVGRRLHALAVVRLELTIPRCAFISQWELPSGPSSLSSGLDGFERLKHPNSPRNLRRIRDEANSLVGLGLSHRMLLGALSIILGIPGANSYEHINILEIAVVVLHVFMHHVVAVDG
jgi:hypothetical protein